jgi:hypothetical protein
MREEVGEKKKVKYPKINEILRNQVKHQFAVFGVEKGKEKYQMRSFYPELEQEVDRLLSTKEGCGVGEVIARTESEKLSTWGEDYKIEHLDENGGGAFSIQKEIIEAIRVKAKKEGEYTAYNDIVETILVDDDKDILKYAQEERAKLSKLSDTNQ